MRVVLCFFVLNTIYNICSNVQYLQGLSVVGDKSQPEMKTSDTAAIARISPEKDELMYKIDDVPPW